MSSDIVIESLRKSYAGKGRGSARTTIFESLDMRIAAGELVALVGPSGCGKSTLLNLVAGLDDADRGRISFVGNDADTNLSVVFQQPRLIDWLTVEENIAMVFERHGRLPVQPQAQIIQDLLRKVGLTTHAKTYPQFLSGGQKQRVAIARAFAIDPDILLLDEPFSALDELTARRLRMLLQELWISNPERRPTGILVTHNMLEAAFLADRIYVMGGHPAHFTTVIDVEVPRPRLPESPEVFDIHRRIMAALD